jgi:hypothetical protein
LDDSIADTFVSVLQKGVDALSTVAFDATDPAILEKFFGDLPATINLDPVS